MRMQVSGISGRTVAEIGGVTRTLACDMRAAEYLFTSIGELWTYWMAERCIGSLQEIGGVQVRVVDQMPREDLGTLLVALLASDRARTGRIDTAESLLTSFGEDGLLEAQQLATYVVQPCFSIPGKGLIKEKHRRRRKKRDAWDWKRVLETAFGLLGMRPEVFWDLTLVEWQTSMSGFSARERLGMQKLAWLSRNQLIAAGAAPADVTVAKLLGEKEPTRRRSAKQVSIGPDTPDSEKKASAGQLFQAFQKQNLERQARAEAIGVEAEQAEFDAWVMKQQGKARRKARKEEI